MSARSASALIGAVPRRSQGELPQRGKRMWPGPLVLSIAGKNAYIFPDALRASSPLIHRKDWNKPC